MPKIKVSLGIGIANCTQEDVLDIDDAEWDDCETDEERAELMEQYFNDWSNNYIDGSYVRID